VRIATFNVNGINGRLPSLLAWLKEAAPHIVCLQELKAPDEKFSGGSHSRRRLWRNLAWSKKLERRSDPGAERTADGNPPRLAWRPRRCPQPLYRGNGRAARLYPSRSANKPLSRSSQPSPSVMPLHC
jgi:hypothetical protein